MLLEAPGIKVNARNSLGKRPLHCAVSAGREAIVKLLLGHSAIDINTGEKFGMRPLDLAIGSGLEHIAKLLLNASGIEVNAEGDHQLRSQGFAREGD